MPSTIRRVGLTFALLFSLLCLASPATASETPGTPQVSRGQGVAVSARVLDEPGGGADRGVCSAGQGVYTADLLPVTRWSSGMSFHSRLGWKDVGDKVMREGVMGLGMAAGNTFWSLSTGAVQAASAFCPLERAGGLVDKAFYKVGSAVWQSPVLALLAVAALLGWVFRVFRGGAGQPGMLFKKGMVLALFGVMLAGANASTGGGIAGDATGFRPGIGSPGWFVVTTDQITSTVAGSVVGSMTGITQAASASGQHNNPTYNPNSPYSCESYLTAMRAGYRDNYKVAGQNYKQAAALPLALNSYWEQSGLAAWRNAQFGTRSNYGDIVYCRMLEANTDQEVDIDDGALDEPADGTIEGIMVGAGAGKVDENAMAWRSSSVNNYRDRIYVAWAACVHQNKDAGSTSGWDIPEDRMGLWPDNNYAGSPAEECNRLFADNNGDRDGSEEGNNANAFDWESGGGKIDADAQGSAEKDFLKNLHGSSVADGTVIVIVYCLSAFLLLLVFGGFAIAIIFAKTLALVMMIGVLAALLGALMPNSDMDRLARYGKQYIGVSFFGYGAALLLSVLTLLTGILVGVGNETLPGGQGGILPMLWTGVAPFVAVLCMHMMFKRLRVPSPFSPTSASAWGKAAAGGALGGAVGGAVGGAMASRMGGRAKAAVANGIKSKVSDVRKRGTGTTSDTNGTGKMAPKDTGPSTGAEPGAAEGAGSTDETQAPPSTRGERKAEREAAADWAASEDGQQQVEAAKQAARPGIKAHLADRSAAAWAQFKAKPLRTSLKYAAVGVAASATGGLAGAGLLAAALGSRAVGREGIRRTGAAAGRTTGSTVSSVLSRPDAETVAAYRAEQARRKAEEAQREAAEREAAEATQPSGQPDPTGWKFIDPPSAPPSTGPQGRSGGVPSAGRTEPELVTER